MDQPKLPTRTEIKRVLRSMDPVSASAAMSLADLLVDHKNHLNDEQMLNDMACAAIVKAMVDDKINGEVSVERFTAILVRDGEQIAMMATLMAAHVLSGGPKKFVVGAVGVALAGALLALGA